LNIVAISFVSYSIIYLIHSRNQITTYQGRAEVADSKKAGKVTLAAIVASLDAEAIAETTSIVLAHHPHFINQQPNVQVFWGYTL
jgi:myosin-crossreactive antigen